jgi:hypothetical protein
VPSSIFDSCRLFWKQPWRRKSKSKHNTKDVVVEEEKVDAVEEDGVEVVVAWEVEAEVMVEEVRVDADVDEAVAEDLADAETGEDEVEAKVVAEEKEEESNTPTLLILKSRNRVPTQEFALRRSR